jgi:hypothetical protein
MKHSDDFTFTLILCSRIILQRLIFDRATHSYQFNLMQVLTNQPEGQLQIKHKYMWRDKVHDVQYTYVGHRKENFEGIMKMKRQIQADKGEDCDIRFILQEKYTKEIQQ